MKCQYNPDCKHDAVVLIQHPDLGPIPGCGFCSEKLGQGWRSLPKMTKEAEEEWEGRKDEVAAKLAELTENFKEERKARKEKRDKIMKARAERAKKEKKEKKKAEANP